MNNFGKSFRLDQLCDRDASNAGATRDRYHRVTVTTHEHSRDVFYAHIEFHGKESAEPGRIQDACLADNAVGRKAEDLECTLYHGIQRVADHDDNGVWAAGFYLLRDACNDLGVGT